MQTISHENRVGLVKDHRVKIDLAKLIELRGKDVPVTDIAKMFDCSEVAIYKQLKKFKTDPAHTKSFSKSKDQVYEFLQQEIVNSLSADEIKKIPGIQKFTSLAILEDKIRLIQGKSTENVSVKSITEHFHKELNKAQELLRSIEES